VEAKITTQRINDNFVNLKSITGKQKGANLAAGSPLAQQHTVAVGCRLLPRHPNRWSRSWGMASAAASVRNGFGRGSARKAPAPTGFRSQHPANGQKTVIAPVAGR
jgi:hypothetical protein